MYIVLCGKHSLLDLSHTPDREATPATGRKIQLEGGREEGKEGRREGGKEGRREGGKEGRREGGKEGRRERGELEGGRK